MYKIIQKYLFLALSLFSLGAHADEQGLPLQLTERMVVPFQEEWHLPALAVVIYYQGKDYYYFYGNTDDTNHQPINKDTIFELASISKVFTSTLLATQLEAGTIALKDPVVMYLPRLKETENLPIDKVKVYHLATHSSAFPRQVQDFGVKLGDVSGFFDALKTWEPDDGIGSRYRYSNIGFGLLGIVVDNAAKSSYADLLKKLITQPLGMTHTFTTVPEDFLSYRAQGHRPDNARAGYYSAHGFVGGGGVHASAADMLAFLKANLGIPVNNASSRLLYAMKITQRPYYKVNKKLTLGLAWELRGTGDDLIISKNGMNQGFTSFIGFSSAKQFGVVVLTNKAQGKATLLGNQILAELAKNSDGYQINYPENAVVKHDFNSSYLIGNAWRYGADGKTGKSLLSISLTPKTQADMADVSVRIGVSDAPSDLKLCTAGSKETKKINGITFSVFPYTDTAMQKTLQGVSYRTVHNSQCYAIEQVMTYSLASIQEPTERKKITKILTNAYINLWNIIKTFRFGAG